MTSEELNALYQRHVYLSDVDSRDICSLIELLKAERARVAEATALINAAVQIMTTEQVAMSAGLWAWLEWEE